MIRTAGSTTIASPTSAPPGSTCSTPAGSPASSNTRANIAPPEIAVRGSGLRITALPSASAGATARMARIVGTLNGAITPTTPAGTRRAKDSRGGRCAAAPRTDATAAPRPRSTPARWCAPGSPPNGWIAPDSRASQPLISSRWPRAPRPPGAAPAPAPRTARRPRPLRLDRPDGRGVHVLRRRLADPAIASPVAGSTASYVPPEPSVHAPVQTLPCQAPSSSSAMRRLLRPTASLRSGCTGGEPTGGNRRLRATRGAESRGARCRRRGPASGRCPGRRPDTGGHRRGRGRRGAPDDDRQGGDDAPRTSTGAATETASGGDLPVADREPVAGPRRAPGAARAGRSACTACTAATGRQHPLLHLAGACASSTRPTPVGGSANRPPTWVSTVTASRPAKPLDVHQLVVVPDRELDVLVGDLVQVLHERQRRLAQTEPPRRSAPSSQMRRPMR